MEWPPLLLQVAGSLVAILALAALARSMRLGGSPRLDSAEAVQRAAGEVEDGFAPVEIACDSNGAAALARDASGRIMVIRRHGNRFAGRVLGTQAKAALLDEAGACKVIIDCGEQWFGITRLDVAEPKAWADAINRVSGASHA